MLTLTKPYKPKKCATKEFHDLNNYLIDQLIGTLSTFQIGDMEEIKREKKRSLSIY